MDNSHSRYCLYYSLMANVLIALNVFKVNIIIDNNSLEVIY